VGKALGSPRTIDVELLLAPVSEAAPSGANIRDDLSPSSPYFKLKDARSAARAAERRADAEGESPGLLPEWRTILDIAPKVLVERSKDLEVTVWLIEALVRTQGFAGLRDGFSLARGLVEKYWETLFSLADEEGVATKVAPLTGLNGQDSDGTLFQPLRKVPLTKSGADGPFAAYRYDQALALSKISDAAVRARREKAGDVTLERFTAAVNASGGIYYIGLIADIEESIAELDALGKALDERAGPAAPPSSGIRNALQAILETVRHFSKDLVESARLMAEANIPQPEEEKKEAGTDAGGNGAGTGPIRNREDALRVLLQVADYFSKYEPHSPISTSLQEIVRRARLPFSELLAELLPDTTAWRSVLTSAGIKPPNTK
jgi:type VI secretion system protein ImpA